MGIYGDDCIPPSYVVEAGILYIYIYIYAYIFIFKVFKEDLSNVYLHTVMSGN